MIDGEAGGPPDDPSYMAPGGGGGGSGCIIVKTASGIADLAMPFLTPRASPALRQGTVARD
jgi:hypothetical protein